MTGAMRRIVLLLSLLVPGTACFAGSEPLSGPLGAGVTLEESMPEGAPVLRPVLAFMGDQLDLQLRGSGHVELAVYDTAGELINRCWNDDHCQMRFNAKVDGAYFVAVQAQPKSKYTLTIKRLVTAIPVDPVDLRERWGCYAEMVGKELIATSSAQFPGQTSPQATEVRMRLDWIVPGQKLISRAKFADGWRDVGTTEWDPAARRLTVTVQYPIAATSYARALPDGSVESLEYTTGGISVRGVTRSMGPGRFETSVEMKRDGGGWSEASRQSMRVAE